MKEKNIVQIIKNKEIDDLSPVTLVYGTENLLKKQLVEIIKEKTEKDIHIFWGDELDLKHLAEVFSSSSLFSTGNIAVVFDAELFLEKFSKKDLEKFFSLIDTVKNGKDNLIFILNKEKIPSKEPYKTLVKNSDIIVSNKLTPKAFLISLKKKIENSGKSIDDETLKYLASKLKNSLEYAKQEVEKLLLYTKDKEKIEKEDIDAVITPKIEENIFSFITSFFSKDKNSITSLENLFETGYHPFEIQSLILSYTNKALLVYHYRNSGYSIDKAFEKVGIKHPAQKGTFKKILSSRSKEELIDMVKDLYNLEISQKMYFEDIEKKLKEFILEKIHK